MNGVVEELVEEVRRLISRRREEGKDQSRVLIGVCGIPGSGKSQLAAHVADRLNAGLQERQTVVIGMDGWHLTRDELARMKDPEKARARRGAPWTFDDESFAHFVERLRSIPSNQTVYAPSFSHAKKDPVQDDIAVLPTDRTVLIEGLYANVNEGAWARAAGLYDARWVIECDEEVAMQRLKQRHVDTGVASSIAEAEWRSGCGGDMLELVPGLTPPPVENNDLPNGRYLLSHVAEPARRVKSADDVSWRGAG